MSGVRFFSQGKYLLGTHLARRTKSKVPCCCAWRISWAPHFSALLPVCCQLLACLLSACCLLASCRYHGKTTVLAPMLARGSSFLSLGLHLKPFTLRASRARPPQNPFSGEPTLPTLNDEEVSLQCPYQALIWAPRGRRRSPLRLPPPPLRALVYPRAKSSKKYLESVLFMPSASPTLTDQTDTNEAK